MLTLGLMEGVLSAALGILFLVGAADQNAPLHKIFGPVVTLTLGLAAYGIYASGAVDATSDVVGLGFFAFVGFFLPLGIMRWAWKATKALQTQPAKSAPARTGVAAAAKPEEKVVRPAA